jgi:copper chaperone CopZ
MKTLRILVSVILLTMISSEFAVTFGNNSITQELKTEKFKVWGKCESCKARIENAAKAQGAASASWDQESMMLTVTFNPQKTNSDEIQKKIASVGHDTEKYKAPADVYDKLPSCCKYDRPQ